ncbi:SMI1/KNR4 family protein [Myceligenerans crystallogenes]|uniref:SMI1/KNR4 family protein n=1 Tax=Myceligenerans crystallogenes TaxID=316335 RepID=UPI0031D9CD82
MDENVLLQRLRWRVAIGVPIDWIWRRFDDGTINSCSWHDIEGQRAIRERRYEPQVPRSPVPTAAITRFEERTGTAFPLLLRRLYTEVADGGFGPGYGLFPLDPPSEHPRADSVTYLYDKHLGYRRDSYLQGCDEPLIPIADHGCAITSYATPSGVVWEHDPNTDIERAVPTNKSLHAWLTGWLGPAPTGQRS